MKAKAVCGAVMPHQLGAGPLPYRPDGTGKTEGILFVDPFHNASSGKTDKFRVGIFQGHCQILPQSVPFKRFFRHQGSESQGNRTGLFTGNADSALKVSAAGRQIAVVP